MNFAKNIIDTDRYYLESNDLIETLKMVKHLSQPSYADLRRYLPDESIDEIAQQLQILGRMGAIETVAFAEVKITHYGEILIGLIEGEIVVEKAP